jgi:hypothetical protein
MRLIVAGAILLNVTAFGYLLKARLETPSPAVKPEVTIEPAKIRRLERKQIPSLALAAAGQRTALKPSAVRVN